MFFKQQVIRRCAVIMPVGFDTFLCKLILKAKLDCLFEDLIIDRNSVISDNDSIREVNSRRRHIPPSVFSDLFNVKSFGGISVQDISQHVLGVFRQEFRNLIFACQYFLIQLGRLRIFKWQTPTQHSIQDNTAAPNINHDSLISIFTLNHFRSSITRRPTCCFKPFIFPISVRKPKINNPDSLIIVDQEILGFEIPMNDVQLMNVLNTTNDLLEYFTSFRLRDSAINERFTFCT